MTVDSHVNKNSVPIYFYSICDQKTDIDMGNCDLRVGYNENTYYGGNIGYTVYEPYRGNHYAAKACRLLFKLAKMHYMTYLIITCNPDNIASRKTCEYLGCKLIEVVDLPSYNDMYLIGERQKCVYKIEL